MGNAEAGWYDDGAGYQRWWDGEAWTEYFADMSGTTVELHAPTPLSRTQSMGWYDDGRGRLRWWDGEAWTPLTQFLAEPHTFAGLTVSGEWIFCGDLSQPVAGAIASFETAGEISERSTLTRAAAGGLLFGPAGMITGAMLRKKVDRREFYISIDGPEQVWVAPVDPAFGLQARQFVGWVNSVSRHHLRREGGGTR
ncbi:DUF2510 domain-containing protein [Microbacterium sp. zg.Y1090]|uniref:DUF2510 domain-containing protein n=1 Tax=Microbacterium TaxID=33882 RepID=UPI00214C3F3E|nr:MULTISPECIES: DUF2510 domain-containing protein [unclassified Microbacterium]MCR2812774.1 DUF2510 domain-containing protein [Microbacterium sp. zg.Y1084]MCR2817430.1 DUF2510 domain-containing protein [Microbacterium sp. zg.Y1090]MDL5485926.1 DUF2510 domain-containing protein [Microbacterium sp. zg-Y1211]WIM29084.1 DUF2510 domain-containing protein [Microbacterium sp. zg-Y1090]